MTIMDAHFAKRRERKAAMEERVENELPGKTIKSVWIDGIEEEITLTFTDGSCLTASSSECLTLEISKEADV